MSTEKNYRQEVYNVTDVTLLNERIEESGLKSKVIYDRLGISKASWYLKRAGKRPFTAQEIQKLCEVLRITSLREKERIFFSDM